MAKWKIVRQNFDGKEYNLVEGIETTIGRGVNNTVTLSSLVISRQHCVLKVAGDKVTLQDLKSSNGTFLGSDKIKPNVPVVVKESDLIGIGWSDEASVATIADNEKFVFKLIKDKSLSDRLQFQGDIEFEELEEKIATILESTVNDSVDKTKASNMSGPSLNEIKQRLKRKSQVKTEEDNDDCIIIDDQDQQSKHIICVKSDSEGADTVAKKPTKKVKLESVFEEDKKLLPDRKEKNQDDKDLFDENNDIEYDVFNVKQEILEYNDEPIPVDSDSDCESDRWFMRLSQSSPGKSLSQEEDRNILNDSLIKNEDNTEEDYINDLIKIPEKPFAPSRLFGEDEQVDGYSNAGISSEYFAMEIEKENDQEQEKEKEHKKDSNEHYVEAGIAPKKIQMIDPIAHSSRRKLSLESKPKNEAKSKNKSKRGQPSESHKKKSESLKEERRKKLKEIATKEREQRNQDKSSSETSSKVKTNVKVTNSTRSAFLAETVTNIKVITKKPSPRNVKKDKPSTSNTKKSGPINGESKSKTKRLSEDKDTDQQSISNILKPTEDMSTAKPLNDLEHLSNNNLNVTSKPVSKVVLQPVRKPKKSVTFSEEPPQVWEFFIEPGKQLKKTSSVRSAIMDLPKTRVFSLEKITLTRILRWNPQWLTEQINNNEPPPILGHQAPPMSVLHFFQNHTQYVQVIGDLLLMEIWEYITQAYMRKRNQNENLKMTIESLSPIPTQDRCLDIFNLSVNISLPKNDTRNVPRMGELMIVTFGPENNSSSRFFYIHNVRNIHRPHNHSHSSYNVSLHTVYTDKMISLRHGDVLLGKVLTYIRNELTLFEAMEYLAESPLCATILRPAAQQLRGDDAPLIQSQWTSGLNASQLRAVSACVAAAAGERPALRMVQGPPGTGKSRVICSIVMSYFYDMTGKKKQNRKKILICASSNAAVDELVIRLLQIRQSLPKSERFRMVRVGRPEAMAGRARELCSQNLAQRDLQRAIDLAAPADEIALLEARLNMWKTQVQDAKDKSRIAYCQGQIESTKNKLAQARGGAGREQLPAVERRIVEGADIIATTISSAANFKIRGLRGRIALCVVDEAGQAIEPETLIPLTLDVRCLALVGDPQQLPGFICSQRAKKHGLGESLFARLSACVEEYRPSPTILLDVQYRMQPAIADYPTRAFYGGRIRHEPAPRPAFNLPPYLLVYISSGDKGQVRSGANACEARGVSRVAAALAAAARRARLSLAVITPYNAHKDLIRDYLKEADPSASQVEVNTVDSFQGQERDVVLVSLARSQGAGFLSDAGRMNVMLTRARHSLLVCLNPYALAKHPQWRTLMDDAQERNLYTYLPNKVCQPPSVVQLTDEEVLSYIRPAS